MKNIVFINMLILITGCLNCYSKDFLITDYGAVSGKLSTPGIQKAVDECYACGGGKVLIPPGTFITGPVFLRSNTDIYLESGAVLKGSENIDDYKVNGDIHGIFYCEDETNISISGHGTIDASGSHFYDSGKNHVADGFDRSVIRQKESYMPEGIFFSDGPIKRISMPGMTMVFYNCTRVSITGITIKDTPIWATRFAYCDDILIDGITIQNNVLIPNSDGIHCTASRNIRISVPWLHILRG